MGLIDTVALLLAAAVAVKIERVAATVAEVEAVAAAVTPWGTAEGDTNDVPDLVTAVVEVPVAIGEAFTAAATVVGTGTMPAHMQPDPKRVKME